MTDTQTKLYAILGSPVSHSLSPYIYNLSFEKDRLNAAYLAFDCKPDKLKNVLTALKTLGFKGGNVTYPLKRDFYKLSDFLSGEASFTGSVNCFKIGDDKKIYGYNTDCIGFENFLKSKHISTSDKNILLIGAGGAGSAIGYALASSGAKKLYIKGNTLQKPISLIKKIRENFSNIDVDLVKDDDQLRAAICNMDLIINATPVGMGGSSKLPVPQDIVLNKESIAVDIIYNPLKTPFLKKCELCGMKTYNGLGMLIHQAEDCYKLWTNSSLDIEFIQNKIKTKLALF